MWIYIHVKKLWSCRISFLWGVKIGENLGNDFGLCLNPWSLLLTIIYYSSLAGFPVPMLTNAFLGCLITERRIVFDISGLALVGRHVYLVTELWNGTSLISWEPSAWTKVWLHGAVHITSLNHPRKDLLVSDMREHGEARPPGQRELLHPREACFPLYFMVLSRPDNVESAILNDFVSIPTSYVIDSHLF